MTPNSPQKLYYINFNKCGVDMAAVGCLCLQIRIQYKQTLGLSSPELPQFVYLVKKCFLLFCYCISVLLPCIVCLHNQRKDCKANKEININSSSQASGKLLLIPKCLTFCQCESIMNTTKLSTTGGSYLKMSRDTAPLIILLL